ncbi:cysteine synthase B, partial [Bordetella pertussis B200]
RSHLPELPTPSRCHEILATPLQLASTPPRHRARCTHLQTQPGRIQPIDSSQLAWPAARESLAPARLNRLGRSGAVIIGGMSTPTYPTIEQTVGNTPLVRLQRIPGAAGQARGNVILAKLEGNNPAGSVKDRPALSMILRAEERGEIHPGDTLIEATSGNTGIALAMTAAMRGYRMVLIMPDNLSLERRAAMTAYGAELILTPAAKGGMEYARDLATAMQAEGKGKVLDQFGNPDNPRAHIEGTGPEIWNQTDGRVTHFVSAMGTTGTIMGVSTYLKSRNAAVQVVGAQPAEGSQIPGIRKWPEAYMPKIFDRALVDAYESIAQAEEETMARRLAAEEGIFAGISSAGALVAALRVAERVENATIVFIVCDRGDRYLSTGVFN